MAVIYGEPGKEAGDQKVFLALHALPDEFIVYAQPLLVHKSERREPDYVIIYSMGVIVLEVKDWIHVLNIHPRGLEVYRTDEQRWDQEKSPVDQARQASFVLNNMLTEDKELCNYAGRLDFSYAYGVVLPNLPPLIISNCNKKWGDQHVLGQGDLSPDKIQEKIKWLHAPFHTLLTDAQMSAVRAILDGNNKIIDKNTGEFKGVLDPAQESIAKEVFLPQKFEPQVQPVSQDSLFANLFPEPETRKKHLESEVPAEVIDMQSDMHVRLVRGFAGTGKTDVLVLRAQFLAGQNKHLKILVTTFNDPLFQKRLNPELAHLKGQIDVFKFDTLCAGIYKKRNEKWKEPQPARGLIASIAKNNSKINDWGIDFLADEFTWIKESERTSRKAYTTKPREGRGGESHRVLSNQQKNQIFDLFQQYQHELNERSTFDWADLHDKTLKYLNEGYLPDKKYNVILIDEAQHFAPVWVRIIKHFLEPEGVLFLCDDPSQSVFRFFSWRQKGIDVIGKTRWLKVPYRNTRQIFEAAFSLIAMDDLAKKLLGEDKNFAIPDLSNPNLRDGDKPLVRKFESVLEEKQFIQKEIQQLIENGLRPSEVCILHTQKYVLDAYHNLFNDSINIENAIRQTGLEYKAVFIPQVQKLFEQSVGNAWEVDQSKQRANACMYMTRARNYLYMTYQQKWPKSLESLHTHVDWVVREN